MKKWIVGVVITLVALAGIYYQLQLDNVSTKTTAMPPAENSSDVSPTPNTSTHTPPAEVSKPLAASDIDKLAKLVTDSTQHQEARQKSLYQLTQQGAAALPALSLIANTPVPEAHSQDPHSADQIKQSFEASLRVTAIEALDELATDPKHTEAVKASMLGVLKSQKHRSLTLLAQISLSGIEGGKPGKVKRAIEALVQEQK